VHNAYVLMRIDLSFSGLGINNYGHAAHQGADEDRQQGTKREEDSGDDYRKVIAIENRRKGIKSGERRFVGAQVGARQRRGEYGKAC